MSESRTASSRYREILDVSTKLFAEYGFQGTSMDDIATALGVQKGSLYYWIDSKEKLLLETLSDPLTALLRTAEGISRSTAPAADRFSSLIHHHCRFVAENPDRMRVFLTEAKWLTGEPYERLRGVRRAYYEAFRRPLDEGRADGSLSIEEKLVPVHVNLLFAMMNEIPTWFGRDGALTIDEIATHITELVINPFVGDREHDADEQQKSVV